MQESAVPFDELQLIGVSPSVAASLLRAWFSMNHSDSSAQDVWLVHDNSTTYLRFPVTCDREFLESWFPVRRVNL